MSFSLDCSKVLHTKGKLHASQQKIWSAQSIEVCRMTAKGLWISNAGPILPSKMTDTHLANTIRYLERKRESQIDAGASPDQASVRNIDYWLHTFSNEGLTRKRFAAKIWYDEWIIINDYLLVALLNHCEKDQS